jgi:hypothetical protein
LLEIIISLLAPCPKGHVGSLVPTSNLLVRWLDGPCNHLTGNVILGITPQIR